MMRTLRKRAFLGGQRKAVTLDLGTGHQILCPESCLLSRITHPKAKLAPD